MPWWSNRSDQIRPSIINKHKTAKNMLSTSILNIKVHVCWQEREEICCENSKQKKAGEVPLITKQTYGMSSDFQCLSCHGTCKLITKILKPTKNIFFAYLTRSRHNFDSFTVDSYFGGCCHLLIWQSKRKGFSAPD